MVLDDKVTGIIEDMLKSGAKSITEIHRALVDTHGYNRSYEI